MITRRSILTAAPGLLLPGRPGFGRAFLRSTGAATSQFTPDGTRISSIGPTINSRWGTWSLGPLFIGGPVFYIMLNGKPVTQLIYVQGATSAQWGPVHSTYYLEINYGGNIYGFPNNDTGWCSYQGYSWVPNHTTMGGPAPITGPGFSLPNYSPPYTPSADGTNITPPTSSTLTTLEGVWGFDGTNSYYGGYNVTLNGILLGDNRGGDNTDSGLAPIVGAMRLEVAGNGQMFVLLPDSTWRSWAGLQGNFATSLPSPITNPVPVNLAFITAGSYPYPAVPYTSPSGTLLGTLSATMSDGTTGITPAVSEITIADPTTLAYADHGSGPSLYTVGMQPMNTPIGNIIVMSRNGASYGFSRSVYWY